MIVSSEEQHSIVYNVILTTLLTKRPENVFFVLKGGPMFCSSCGKQIADGSQFCRFCGESQSTGEPSAPTTWEYRDFVHRWPDANRPHSTAGMAHGTRTFQEFFWTEYQREILSKLNKWIDDGWTPATEVGPAALSVQEKPRGCFASLTANSLTVDYELIEARITLKRKVDA